MDWDAKIDIIDNTIQVWVEGEEKKSRQILLLSV